MKQKSIVLSLDPVLRRSNALIDTWCRIYNQTYKDSIMVGQVYSDQNKIHSTLQKSLVIIHKEDFTQEELTHRIELIKKLMVQKIQKIYSQLLT